MLCMCDMPGPERRGGAFRLGGFTPAVPNPIVKGPVDPRGLRRRKRNGRSSTPAIERLTDAGPGPSAGLPLVRKLSLSRNPPAME